TESITATLYAEIKNAEGIVDDDYIALSSSEDDKDHAATKDMELGTIDSGQTVTKTIFLHGGSISGSRIINLNVKYTVIGRNFSEVVEKSESVRIPFTAPFDASFELCSITERLERSIGVDLEKSEKWLLTASFRCFSAWDLEIKSITIEEDKTFSHPYTSLSLISKIEDVDVTTWKTGHIYNANYLFKLHTTDLTEAQPSVPAGHIIITWKRSGVDNEFCNSLITLPSLQLQQQNLVVIADVPDEIYLGEPFTLSYIIYNPTEHIAEYTASIELSEAFVFSGYKQVKGQVLPLSRTVYDYTCYPLLSGKVKLPKLKVIAMQQQSGEKEIPVEMVGTGVTFTLGSDLQARQNNVMDPQQQQFIFAFVPDEWDEQCESEFNACFLTELEKVYCFVQTHLDGLVKRINNFGKILEGKSDFMMNIKYEAIADDIAETLIDVDELAKFHSLNVEAFERIAKRHSRYAERIQQAFNFENALAIYPLYNQRFDPLFVLLSEMYNLCKRKGEPEVMDKVADEPDQVEFERETKKYWIHPDHIAEVKAIILLHLPVHVQSQGKSYKATDAAVSSVYYDNKSFDMYKQKLIQKKGSEIVRVRWYGKCDSLSDDVYVEKKTHRAEWLEGKSVKGRIKIKGQQVNDVMNGRYSAEEYEDEMKNKGILDKEIIEPFQLPNDQRLRICIDSNLTFIREDHLDGKQRRLQDSWRRTDVDINYPFLNVDENDILRFPYAILEVKVQNHLGQEIPSWLSRLLNSDIVHEVPDFSKYLHGVSHFFKDMVNELPPWLSQLDQNIRKPASSRDGITRYALARFHFRAFRLQTGRTDLRLDDIYGPGVLCALLVTALAFNFYVRIPLLFSEERTRILPNPY
ncbi:vacuolar transporter chaperone, partial [Rhizopus azygosporus]